MTGGDNVALLAAQALRWRPKLAVVANERRLPELRERLAGSGVECAGGDEAIVAAAAEPADWVMASIVGVAGIEADVGGRSHRRHDSPRQQRKHCLRRPLDAG